jgi:hypothetical protein
MDNKGLLFIPDISGFTRFVSETEIDHSKMIVQELLELLINANKIDLQISEIEGDAILFYKFGNVPQLKDVYQQVENMFCEFHKHLASYELRRFCQCKACLSAVDLTLKVVTHYGEFTGYNVKNFNKLIGKDVIVAHQLLKNDIENHEYWLVTKNLLENNQLDTFSTGITWNSSAKKTENGDILFHYAPLTYLKESIPPAVPVQFDLSKKMKIASASHVYDTHMIQLFHASGNPNYRSRWQEGVKKVEEQNHFLPRVGMRYRYLLENGTANFFASSFLFHPEHVEFSETDENTGAVFYFTVEKIDEDKTKLTIDQYARKNFFSRLAYNNEKKKKIEASLNRSLTNLETLVAELNVPAEY